MSIRTKLLVAYGIMFMSLTLLGLVYLWSASLWREAALELSAIHLQNMQAEGLRSSIHEQVNRALDYLGGDRGAAQEVWRHEGRIADRLAELDVRAFRPEERDHVEALQETLHELNWALKQTLTDSVIQGRPAELALARARLREYAQETSENVAVLGQYYRAHIDDHIVGAARANRIAQWSTGAVILVALIQLVALVVLSQRWFVKPLGAVGRATLQISTGDFNTRIKPEGALEWQNLSVSINEMAASLGVLEQKLMARERMATLGEAAAYTAHNIRNPLAAIRMTVQVLQSEITRDQAGVHESLSDIVCTVDRLEAWARRFLDFSRPLELQATATDIVVLVSDTARIVQGKFTDGGVSLDLETHGEPSALSVDPLLLEQALAALITNAMEAGTKQVTVATRFMSTGNVGPGVQIEITDDGEGVSETVKPRLFRAFSTDKQGGTGLGLAQAKAIVELHGGTIELSARPGGGTCATIRLPGEASRDLVVNAA